METTHNTTAVDKHKCPDCGGPKKASAKKCKPCYYARGYKQCSEPMCTNMAITKGLCNTHRLRLKRNGRTEHLCFKCGEPATNLAGSPRCDKCRAEVKDLIQRKADVKRLYGMEWDDYIAMIDLQGNKCAICGTSDPGRGHVNLSVDHDHATGKVRGLLCHPCNVGIGSFRDDPALLSAAIRYLTS